MTSSKNLPSLADLIASSNNLGDSYLKIPSLSSLILSSSNSDSYVQDQYASRASSSFLSLTSKLSSLESLPSLSDLMSVQSSSQPSLADLMNCHEQLSSKSSSKKLNNELSEVQPLLKRLSLVNEHEQDPSLLHEHNQVTSLTLNSSVLSLTDLLTQTAVNKNDNRIPFLLTNKPTQMDLTQLSTDLKNLMAEKDFSKHSIQSTFEKSVSLFHLKEVYSKGCITSQKKPSQFARVLGAQVLMKDKLSCRKSFPLHPYSLPVEVYDFSCSNMDQLFLFNSPSPDDIVSHLQMKPFERVSKN